MVHLMKWIPNGISLTRLVLVCFFLTRLGHRFGNKVTGNAYLDVIMLFIVICITDILDGRLARALGVVTALGALLDVLVDLFYIISSLVVLNLMGQIPLWFTVVVTVKFFEFAVTSFILQRDREKSAIWVFDYFGKLAAGLFYVIPGVACMLYMIPNHKIVMNTLLLTTTTLAMVSSVWRCILASKRFPQKPTQ